jgi:hypothetical protein
MIGPANRFNAVQRNALESKGVLPFCFLYMRTRANQSEPRHAQDKA